MLTKGNFQNGQPQGLSDEQQRELQRGTILLQMRRYLRFFCIGLFFIELISMVFSGHNITDSLLTSIFSAVFIYAICVFLFIYIAANWAIKICLYIKSLFGGEARL